MKDLIRPIDLQAKSTPRMFLASMIGKNRSTSMIPANGEHLIGPPREPLQVLPMHRMIALRIAIQTNQLYRNEVNIYSFVHFVFYQLFKVGLNI